ncbi:MAG TPA: hypothetical protein PLE30_01330 [Candidatus Kapabacteria bacterium]|nr:hypothetical protein [Candidatus Kapabacteria bacterium]
MKKFNQILDDKKNKDFAFLSWHKDKDSAGYILSYYADPNKQAIKEDWFLELDELLSYAEDEYNANPEKWQY